MGSDADREPLRFQFVLRIGKPRVHGNLTGLAPSPGTSAGTMFWPIIFPPQSA